MKLKAHQCEEFSVRLRTERNNFAYHAFFKDPRLVGEVKAWEKGEPLLLTSHTHNPRAADYHIHSSLRMVKGIVDLRVRWVARVFAAPTGTKPPFAEGFFPWIARFFKSDVGPTSVIAHYSFPTSRFRSSIALPAPLIIAEPIKRPKMILGMTFSEEFKGASRATVETEIMPDGSIWAMIYASYRAGFRTLTPERLLKEFDRAISQYVIAR